MLVVIILAGIALVLGVSIYFVNKFVPHKVQGIEKTEEIAGILPGINCGACGHPGCFGYAQALTKDADLILKTPCTVVCQDAERLEQLEKALGVTIDASEMNKKALIHCNGNSEVVYNYSGVETCKGAAQLLRGYKKCPYTCLGLGDCLKVCPQDAISIKPENGVAVVDPEKCTGCGLCLTECPQNLIELVPAGTKIAFLCNYAPLRDVPGREKCDAGCIHCRKCHRSCEDDAIEWNKDRAIPEFDIEKCTLCHKCIEACEQNTLADFTKAKVEAEAGSTVMAG
ncbi:4Fe-4S dicluster domain-containing protein [Chloroflexota bacterium]